MHHRAMVSANLLNNRIGIQQVQNLVTILKEHHQVLYGRRIVLKRFALPTECEVQMILDV